MQGDHTMSTTARRNLSHGFFGTSRAVAAALAAASMLTSALPAFAQRSSVIERQAGSDWTLRVNVTVRADGTIDPKTRMPERDPLTVSSAAVVFPVARDSASHVAWNNVGGELKIDGRLADDKPEMLTDYHSGIRLARWKLERWQGESVTLDVTFPVTAFNTRYDDARATQIDWPATWPSAAQTSLQPQMFIDMGNEGPYDMEPVKNLVKRWTEGKDPRTVRPAVLAKFFAGEVWRHVQPSGNGLAFNRQGELEGIDLQGAPETAVRGRGTEFDMVCLLAAVYREAGLPARTVIGFDVGARKRDGNAFLGKTGSGTLRAWVEFALIDNGELVWVPVDVVRMRKGSSQPPRELEREWRWFGTHTELEGIIPFAFQFHPPTTVVSHGSPAFWGWMVSPRPPERVLQSVRIDAIRTPRRANDPNRPEAADPRR
jgi:hypothetical protein